MPIRRIRSSAISSVSPSTTRAWPVISGRDPAGASRPTQASPWASMSMIRDGPMPRMRVRSLTSANGRSDRRSRASAARVSSMWTILLGGVDVHAGRFGPGRRGEGQHGTGRQRDTRQHGGPSRTYSIWNTSQAAPRPRPSARHLSRCQCFGLGRSSRSGNGPPVDLSPPTFRGRDELAAPHARARRLLSVRARAIGIPGEGRPGTDDGSLAVSGDRGAHAELDTVELP